ncbi:MAG: hypothetical protein ACLU84_03385 [Clostridia bacterium]
MKTEKTILVRSLEDNLLEALKKENWILYNQYPSDNPFFFLVDSFESCIVQISNYRLATTSPNPDSILAFCSDEEEILYFICLAHLISAGIVILCDTSPKLSTAVNKISQHIPIAILPASASIDTITSYCDWVFHSSSGLRKL